MVPGDLGGVGFGGRRARDGVRPGHREHRLLLDAGRGDGRHLGDHRFDDEDEDGAAASLAIAKGPRFLFVTAFHDLSDLGPDTLVQIANLVFDEI